MKPAQKVLTVDRERQSVTLRRGRLYANVMRSHLLALGANVQLDREGFYTSLHVAGFDAFLFIDWSPAARLHPPTPSAPAGDDR